MQQCEEGAAEDLEVVVEGQGGNASAGGRAGGKSAAEGATEGKFGRGTRNKCCVGLSAAGEERGEHGGLFCGGGRRYEDGEEERMGGKR